MSKLAAGNGVSLTQAGDRRKYLWAGRTVFDVALDGSDTGGSIALLDQLGRHGDATPRHIHRSEADIFYVLDGLITAWAGEDAHQLHQGGAVYLPPGLPHAFRVESDTARVITITSPAGFADFVRTAGVATDAAPDQWEFDLGRIVSAAPQYDIEIVGPPPD